MITGIIPARGGSKGLPGKNIKLLAGYPLLSYSIIAARLTSTIDRVVVSTDSDDIAEVSRRFGAEVPFMRPAELSGDRSPDRDFVLHALEWFIKNEGTAPDYLVHLRPTTPLRDPKLVDEAVVRFINNSEATSCRSGHEAPESPYKWFLQNEAGYFHGLASDDSQPGYSNLPRQSFPTVYIPDGYVDVLRTSFVMNSADIHGERMLAYISPPCVEVDTEEDFEFLEFSLQKYGSPLFEFLRTHYPKEVR